jgi:ATP/maltotriose-dependent transcriptional regulator MalT
MAAGAIPAQRGEGRSRLCVSHAVPLLSEVQAPWPRTRDFRLDGASPAGRTRWDLSRDHRTLEVLRLGKIRRNLTGASPMQIRRSIGRAWRMILSLRIAEALELTNWIDLGLGDLPLRSSEPIRTATELLRAIGLAFQDESVAALSIAATALKKCEYLPHAQAASALCRFGYWQLGDLDSFYALPRHPPGAVSGNRETMAAVFDLSIEAAVELEQLRLSAARRLALDALTMAEAAPRQDKALAAFPASLAAQVLYEQGYLDEAEAMIRDRLQAINAAGIVECAWRAYLVLARIAVHRKRHEFAALLLREAETLGERRGWVRLASASVEECIRQLLREGRIREAEICAERLDRYAETHHRHAGPVQLDIQRRRILARARIALASAPSTDAVAALRELHRDAVGRQDLYSAVQLAVQLAGSLDAIGETGEADALFLKTLMLGSTLGLYQVFLDGGTDHLLLRAYEHARVPGSNFREVLSYVGSLIARQRALNAIAGTSRLALRAHDCLSIRECEILVLIGRGLSNKLIAQSLKIAPETVKSHAKRIFVKLAVKSRAEAVARAGTLGLM